jgi:hypothetical protein
LVISCHNTNSSSPGHRRKSCTTGNQHI